MATKSVQRTLEYLRGKGYECGIAEHWNAFTKQRYDLFGFIDIIALAPGTGALAVQACGADWGSHVQKLQGERAGIVLLWLQCGNPVQLIGWRKKKALKKDGTKSKASVWVPRIADLCISVADSGFEIVERD